MARVIESEEKKNNARVAAGPEAPGFARSILESVGMILRPLVPLSILIVVYVGISFLLWRPLNGESGAYESSALALLADKSIVAAFAANSRPAWIPPQDYKQIAVQASDAAKDHSVFEAGLSRKVAAVYAQNSWVERVREVRLRYPARMELQVDFRKPCARLDRGGIVDRQGFGLNLQSNSPAARDLPLLLGVAQKNPAAGRQSADRAVLDALDLLAIVRDTLAKSPGNLRVTQVERIDGKWRISTERGPLIMWGAFSDDPPIDEPRTREKSEALHRRLCEWNPALLEYIKLYIADTPVKPRALVGTQEISTPAISVGSRQ